MSKMMERIPMDSTPTYAFDEYARTGFKHQSLLQDYKELQKENKAMKKKLQKSNQRKLTLLAEVSFLRRRYEYLMNLQSPKTSLDLDLTRTHAPETHKEAVFIERSYGERDAALPNPSPILDLNQISNGEEEEESGEIRIAPEPSREKNSKKLFTSRGKKHPRPPLPPRPPSNQKLLVCRDNGKGSNKSVKRKISWQDSMALRV